MAVIITYIGSNKSWSGCNFNRRIGSERGLAQKQPGWSPDDWDAQMFANLASRAWREDPRPLSHAIYYSKEG